VRAVEARMLIRLAFAFVVFSLPSRASAQLDTGLVWGIPTVEIGLAIGIGSFLAVDPDPDLEAPFLIGAGALTMGVGVLIGALAQLGDWTRVPARALHMGFLSGLAAWGVASGAQLDVTEWSWGLGAAFAAIGAVAGALFVDTPEEDAWFGAIGLAALFGIAVSLITTLVVLFRFEDAVSFVAAFPPACIGAAAIGVSIAAGTGSAGSVSVGPSGLRASF
jgi:hypothetical protein